MARVEYKWAQSRKTDANVAAKELARIRRSNGALTPESVVDASRPEDAPLHPEFEWDDSVAAEGYRKYQARTMIRCLVRVETRTTPEHREYTHVRQENADQGEYMPTSTVVTREALLTDAVDRLTSKVLDLQSSLAEIKALSDALTPNSARGAALVLATTTVKAALKAIEAWSKAA